MAAKTLWIIERKYYRQGRNWEPLLDHFPFKHQDEAERSANERQALHPGWQYRAVLFVRSSEAA